METLDYGDDNLPNVTVVETLCVSCMKNGTTRLMLTTIPNFKEVIIGSFECLHCGYSNREIQSGARLSELGSSHIQLKVESLTDLDRQIIKSDFAVVKIPELDFEIPRETQRGVCNTIEGLLKESIRGLQIGQEEREKTAPEIAIAVNEFLDVLNDYASGKKCPFSIIVEDPSGNSYIESLGIGGSDPQIKICYTKRTKKELHDMGFYEEHGDPDSTDKLIESSGTKELDRPLGHSVVDVRNHLPNHLRLAGWDLSLTVEQNVAKLNTHSNKIRENSQQQLENDMSHKEQDDEPEYGIAFSVSCPNCGREGVNEMCQITIPGFRECLIMAFLCKYCGSRSNEIKPMGSYGESAKKWTLKVTSIDDLNRDVLKSDTAAIYIPEYDFEMCTGTLGGVFTTIEGLILKIADSLRESHCIFSGDSADTHKRDAYYSFIEKLTLLTTDPNALPFTFILDDAADLSMISSRNPEHCLQGNDHDSTPIEDNNLVVETYTRTAEQDDDLGITGMNTENYTSE